MRPDEYRALLDPEDEWLFAKERTEEEVQADRESMFGIMAEFKTPYEYITCDKCVLRLRCTIAYDTYNTNGNCLLEK